MRLDELDSEKGMNYDPGQDSLNKKILADTRKPRLTLAVINKLRKMREAHKLELEDRKDYWQTMYGVETGEEEGMMPPPAF